MEKKKKSYEDEISKEKYSQTVRLERNKSNLEKLNGKLERLRREKSEIEDKIVLLSDRYFSKEYYGEYQYLTLDQFHIESKFDEENAAIEQQINESEDPDIKRQLKEKKIELLEKLKKDRHVANEQKRKIKKEIDIFNQRNARIIKRITDTERKINETKKKIMRKLMGTTTSVAEQGFISFPTIQGENAKTSILKNNLEIVESRLFSLNYEFQKVLEEDAIEFLFTENSPTETIERSKERAKVWLLSNVDPEKILTNLKIDTDDSDKIKKRKIDNFILEMNIKFGIQLSSPPEDLSNESIFNYFSIISDEIIDYLEN